MIGKGKTRTLRITTLMVSKGCFQVGLDVPDAFPVPVLTKVIVYAGIGIFAIELLPLFFEYVGWGLRSSV
jgi:hypothetical protein